MRFLPKTHFRWREPKLFLRLNDDFELSKLRWWHQPLWTLTGATLLMINWFLARLNPHKQPPSITTAILIALGGGAFFAYAIPWVISLCPSEVRFYDAYLARIRGNTVRQTKYSDIESFSWRVRNEFATLILTHRKSGREILLGAPPETPQDAVSQFLLNHGVQSKSQSA